MIADLVGSDIDSARPKDFRVERHEDAWVIRNDRGGFWCDALTNCWTANPEDEDVALTFASQEEATQTYLKADRMYEERDVRNKAAIDLLDKLDEANARAED